jgi:sugar O-acyltransferase (sialic acid O-acetyltransferase NeuD family)
MERIILLGGGGHCKSCIDVIEKAAVFSIAGILDIPSRIGQVILNKSIIGTDDDIDVLRSNAEWFFITLGQINSPFERIRLFDLLNKQQVKIPTIISPLAYVSPYANIGKGTIIMHGAVVNAGAVIGENCIINTKSLIEHDVIIGNHCHISTGAIINGNAVLGNGIFAGSGSVCIQGVEVKEFSFIKANSIVK